MNRRALLGTGTVLAGSLLAGCAGRVQSALETAPAVETSCDSEHQPWPTAGGDPARTGQTATDPPPEDATSVDLLANRHTDGRQRLASGLPAVVDNVAYVPTGSDLVAVDLEAPTAEPAWIFDAEDDVDAVPTVACGLVFVPSLNRLAALDPDSGEAHWRVDAGGHEETTIGVHDASVYIAGVNPAAIDMHTGNIRWKVRGGDTLAIDETGIYTTRNTNGGGGIFAHDHDGDPRWHLALGKIVASASVQKETVFVADNRGTVSAIDAATGETNWSRALSGVEKVHAGLAVHGTDLVVPAGTGQTSALVDADTGETRWTAQTGIVTGRPVVGDDWVAFGRTNHGLSIYDRSTGEARRTWSREDHGFGTVAGIVPIDDGFIVRGGTTSGLTLLR